MREERAVEKSRNFSLGCYFFKQEVVNTTLPSKYENHVFVV